MVLPKLTFDKNLSNERSELIKTCLKGSLTYEQTIPFCLILNCPFKYQRIFEIVKSRMKKLLDKPPILKKYV